MNISITAFTLFGYLDLNKLFHDGLYFTNLNYKLMLLLHQTVTHSFDDLKQNFSNIRRNFCKKIEMLYSSFPMYIFVISSSSWPIFKSFRFKC